MRPALIEAAAGVDRRARVREQDIAYVRYAIANKARYDLMWRKALLDHQDAAYKAGANRAFTILDGAMRGDDEARTGGPGDVAAAPSIACWSLVHGFARLALDGMFGTDEQAPVRAAEMLLPHILDRLRIAGD